RTAHWKHVEVDDRLAVQPFPGTASEADRDVDGIAREVGVAQRRFDLELDVGMTALELGEVRREPALAEGLERADAQLARARGELALRAGQLVKHGIDGGEVAASLVGELEARILAAEQCDPEMLLERLDLATQRRWREVQLVGGTLEAEPARREREGAQRWC